MKNQIKKLTLLLALCAMAPITKAMENNQTLCTHRKICDLLKSFKSWPDFDIRERIHDLIMEADVNYVEKNVIFDRAIHSNQITGETLIFTTMQVPEFLIFLLQNRNSINLNHEDTFNRTPLMYALNFDAEISLKLLQILIQHGADINYKNKKGKTVLQKTIHYSPLVRSYLKGVMHDFTIFINNPLARTEAEQKSSYLKMLYKNNVYFIDATILLKKCSNDTIRSLLKECKLFECSKKEKEELYKSGFPITSNEFDMKRVMSDHQKSGFGRDLMIE